MPGAEDIRENYAAGSSASQGDHHIGPAKLRSVRRPVINMQRFASTVWVAEGPVRLFTQVNAMLCRKKHRGDTSSCGMSKYL